ncbi:MAG: hypothetical protein SFU27_02585 [Thermonemataceae bacterium]|nr:hypothetical protein [Thermonemataceae bacterium]
MGTDLYQLGNHKIRFKERHFSELTTEIKLKLDNTVFPNAEFLRLAALRWANSEPRNVRDIREIKTKRHWTYQEESEYYSFAEDKEIEFYGPFNLQLTFDERKIIFWNPPYRYWQWFEMDDDVHRDEWRKYMKHIVNLFGGDRVVYLADNAHHLEEYIYYEGTFEEMENALLSKYGKPKNTFKEVADDFDNSYFIDDFKSIDWSKRKPLEEYLPEPDDTSSTAYDLGKYSKKGNLKKLNFKDEVLHHKRVDDKIHFYHLATVDGLLCIHTGIVGGQEKLEVKLDNYAPFTYESLEEKIKMEGYGSKCDISFTIKFKGWDNIHSWQDTLDEFETELLWNGLGTKGGGSYGGEEREEWFYAVDEKLTMKLLIDLGKKHKASGKIEVYRNNTDNDIFDDGENDDKEKNRTLIFKQ